MMYFNAAAYQILLPLVALLFFKNKIIAKNFLIVLNYSLMLYTVTLISRIYHIVKFVKSIPIESGYHYTVGAFEIRIALLVLVSIGFLYKKFESNLAFSTIAFVLLWMNDSSFSPNDFSFEVFLKMLNYFSLFVGLYALLWLNKQLPSQRIKHV